jgi:hypothetical protein
VRNLSPRPYESDSCWANSHYDCADPLCLCKHHQAQAWDPWDETWVDAEPTAAVEPTTGGDA